MRHDTGIARSESSSPRCCYRLRRQQGGRRKQGVRTAADAVTAAKAEVRALELVEDSVGSLENFLDPKVGAEVAGRVVSVARVRRQEGEARRRPRRDRSGRSRDPDRGRQRPRSRGCETLVANQDRIVANQQKLVEKSYISQNALDEAIAQRNALARAAQPRRARSSTANRNSLRKTKVVAPIDGEVEVQIVAAGRLREARRPACSSSSARSSCARTCRSRRARRRGCRVGQPVRLTSPLMPDVVVEAKIDEIRPTITATSRALDVIVKFDTDGKFRGGGTVNAAGGDRPQDNAIVVPGAERRAAPGRQGRVRRRRTARRSQRMVQTGYRKDGLHRDRGRPRRAARRSRSTARASSPTARRRGGQAARREAAAGRRAGRAGTATASRSPAQGRRVVTLPELSIKRHVFAVMLNAVLVLFGLIAYQRMGMDKLPYIEFPVISVQTTLQGREPRRDRRRRSPP